MSKLIIDFTQAIDTALVDNFIKVDLRNLGSRTRTFDHDWERHELSMRRIRIRDEIMAFVLGNVAAQRGFEIAHHPTLQLWVWDRFGDNHLATMTFNNNPLEETVSITWH